MNDNELMDLASKYMNEWLREHPYPFWGPSDFLGLIAYCLQCFKGRSGRDGIVLGCSLLESPIYPAGACRKRTREDTWHLVADWMKEKDGPFKLFVETREDKGLDTTKHVYQVTIQPEDK